MNKFKIVLLALGMLFSLSFAGPVSVYGALKTCTEGGKGRICGSKGDWNNKPVQVRGISFGWSNTGWESAKFFNANAVNAMVEDWGAEIVRAPLGSRDDDGKGTGYDTDPSNWTRVRTVVDAAIAKDVYVIIDWHSHHAEDELAAATTFFINTVAEYHNVPNVIFEIYNEPIGNWNDDANTWNSIIKPYANNVIPAIRNAGANNLILVGTPFYSSNPSVAVNNEVTDSRNNTGYVFHFYAQAHSVSNYGPNITTAINDGLSVFITEYGTTHNDGGLADAGHYNTHDAASANNWHTFMDNNKISSAAWNFNNKYEGSSFFGISSNWNIYSQLPANYRDKALMTVSGQYIFDKLNDYKATAPWRAGEGPGGSSSSGETQLDNFAEGSDIAKTGEAWFNGGGGDDTAEDPNGIGSISNEGEPVNPSGYAEITDISLYIDNWNQWAQAYIGLDAVNNGNTYNLSQCTDGFSYEYRGNAHRFMVKIGVNEDEHYSRINEASTWTKVTVKSDEFEHDDLITYNPTPSETLNFSQIKGFLWLVRPEEKEIITGYLQIRNFICHGDLNLDNVVMPGPGESSSSTAPGGSSSSSAPEESSSSTAPGGSSSSSIPVESSSSSAPVITGPVQLDNFAEGSEVSKTGEYWFNEGSGERGGVGSISNEGEPVNAAGYAEIADINLYIENWDPQWAQAFIGLDAMSNGDTYNLSQCTDGFSYEYRGKDHRFIVKVPEEHFISMDAKTTWTKVTVKANQFNYESETTNWQPQPSGILDFDQIKGFLWLVRPKAEEIVTGYLQIRNFVCNGNLDLSRVEMPGDEPSSSSGSEPESSSSAEQETPSSSSNSDDTPIISIYTGTGNIGVVASGNRLLFENLPANAKVQVYNMHGQKQGTENLSKGLYLVKVNSRIFKVPVR